MGRFLSRDTWAGAYNRPLSLNRWNYVISNPINLTDPSGYAPDINYDPRDLTDWLYREMIQNASNDPIVLYMRAQNRIAKRLFGIGTITCGVGLIPEPAMPIIISAGLGIDVAAAYTHISTLYPTFYDQVKNGARWDFKDEIGLQLGQGITLCGASRCYNDVEYSVPGNIFYGYIGRASGLMWWEIKGGAGWAESNDPSHDPNSNEYVPDAPLGEVDIDLGNLVGSNLGDESHDNAAVTLGIKLWDKYQSQLTLPQFMNEINMYVGQLQRHAPSSQSVRDLTAQYWPYPVGYFNNQGRDYVPGQP